MSILFPAPSSPFWPRLVASVLLLSSLCLQAVSAQTLAWYPNTMPDYGASNNQAHNVEHTGADHVPLRGKTFRVMCWDGDQPALGWSFGSGKTADITGTIPLQGAQIGKVTDPDVVADPNDFGANPDKPTTDVVVIYLLDGSVTYEVWEYDAFSNSMTPITPPTMLSSSGYLDNSPNVDVDGQGHAVFTWGHDYLIFAQTYDMPSRQLGPTLSLIAYGGNNYGCAQPDVAVSDKGKGGTVSFIYVVTNFSNSNDQMLCMRQISRLDIDSGVWLTTMGTDVLPKHKGPYVSPRVAAPVDYYTFGSCDLEAVVSEPSSNAIIGLNISNSNAYLTPATLPVATVLNDSGGLRKLAMCSQPVVSYCFDDIEIAWTMTDGTLFNKPAPPIYTGDQEIVQVHTTWDGNPGTNYNYNIINEHSAGNQSVPSVAGRFAAMLNPVAANSVTARALYCFFDENEQEIFYKSLDYFNPYTRHVAPAASTSQPVSAYPNPFREQTTLTLTLAENESVQSLEVYDPMGQPVRGLKLPLADARGTQEVHWDTADLKPGVYQVRVHTSGGASYSYRVQHE